MEAVQDKSLRFWNRYAKKYAKQAIAEPDVYKEKLTKTQAFFTTDTRVLEFGCGTGSTALIHAPLVKEIVASDYSQEMIDIAKEKAATAGIENVDFRVGKLEELGLEPASFDVVLAMSVIHLVDDIDKAIKEAYDLLAPGGVFISSTACVKRANIFMRMFLPLASGLGFIPKVNVFELTDLEASMRKAGFDIKESLMLNKGGMTCFMIAEKPQKLPGDGE